MANRRGTPYNGAGFIMKRSYIFILFVFAASLAVACGEQPTFSSSSSTRSGFEQQFQSASDTRAVEMFTISDSGALSDLWVVIPNPPAKPVAALLRYLELDGMEFYDPAIVGPDTARAQFFVYKDWLLAEVFEFEEEQEIADFDLRRTAVYKYTTEGWEFMAACSGYGLRSVIPPDDLRMAYVRKWLEPYRNGRLLLLMHECPAEVPAKERAEARKALDEFLDRYKRFSIEGLERLERDAALIYRLRGIILNLRSEEYSLAARLTAEISPDVLQRARAEEEEFSDTLKYVLEVWPKEEEERLKEEARMAEISEKGHPEGIVSELTRVAPKGFEFRVSLRNKTSRPITARIDPEVLAPERGNVKFLIWRPGSQGAREHRPYRTVLDVEGYSTTLAPGKSIDHVFDLTDVFDDDGCYEIQAVVAYASSPRSNVLRVCR